MNTLERQTGIGRVSVGIGAYPDDGWSTSQIAQWMWTQNWSRYSGSPPPGPGPGPVPPPPGMGTPTPGNLWFLTSEDGGPLGPGILYYTGAYLFQTADKTLFIDVGPKGYQPPGGGGGGGHPRPGGNLMGVPKTIGATAADPLQQVQNAIDSALANAPEKATVDAAFALLRQSTALPAINQALAAACGSGSGGSSASASSGVSAGAAAGIGAGGLVVGFLAGKYIR